MREARSAIYEQVATIDSLELHRQRDIIADLVLADLQSRLELSDPGIFTVTRVVIRALNTDPSVVIPANMEGFNLLLGTDTLQQSQP